MANHKWATEVPFQPFGTCAECGAPLFRNPEITEVRDAYGPHEHSDGFIPDALRPDELPPPDPSWPPLRYLANLSEVNGAKKNNINERTEPI